MTGHKQLDHTADLALEFWAPSEADLLVHAAEVIVAILTEEAPAAPESTWSAREVDLSSLDREDRLVVWLNEVLFLAIAEGFLLRAAALSLRADGLSAELRGEGEAFGKIATELKGVTYHDLLLTQDGDLWRARVIIDV